jgi:large subunit ribosomal protein L9
MVELVLVKDIEHLGKRGTKVRVREGYARNYLVPMKAAVPATEDNLRWVEKARVKWLAEEAKLIEELRELAGHIAKLDLMVMGKASEQGNLYGSITEKTIAEAAKQKGVAFDVKAVRLPHHLKEVGDYEVPIFLHEQVQLAIPVKVRAEGRPDWIPSKEQAAEAAPAPEAAAKPAAAAAKPGDET